MIQADMNRRLALLLFFLTAAVYGQKIDITGNLEWNKMEIQALVSLDLASANLRLPSGRTQGEEIIKSEYGKLIQPFILGIQADSSSTLADLVQRGEWSLTGLIDIARNARAVSPFLSQDMLRLQAAYRINLEDICSVLMRHTSPAEIRRTLIPAPAPAYTGIIIIAAAPLPVHGMQGSATLIPCLFPKIWDTDMNPVYERNMLERGKKTMVLYAPQSGLFHDSPSGLSPEITSLAGDKPLRIMARGIFGDYPTDPIIDSADALTIISAEANRRLLREGRVVIIVADSTLNRRIGD
jgi:hypothetical protein